MSEGEGGMSDRGGKRASWSGQLGFILAAAASAVGLGNLWRFPASAATYGGGIFILLYVLLFFCFGIFMMSTEIAIGRATRLSPSKAFSSLDRRWSFIGWLATLVPVLILPYYSVIGGWVVKYFASYAVTPDAVAQEGFFEGFVGSPAQTIGMTALFAAGFFGFIFAGVRKGIELSNKVLMPLLLFLTIGIAVFTVTRPDAGPGLRYCFVPDFGRLCVDGRFSFVLLAKTALAALGQMFFSLSLAMGIMITYGSYVPKRSDIVRSSFRIGLVDSLVALLAGAIIIPPVFAVGGEKLAQTGGVGLMFISLPQVFARMPGTQGVALAFFALCLFAALTSALSMAETVVSSICDYVKWNRTKATVVTACYTLVASVPSAMSIGFLEKTDFITNSILMPVCAFLTCVFIGWIAGTGLMRREMTAEGRSFPCYGFYRIVMRYVAPVLLLVILTAYTLSGLGVFSF